ncbi:MAG: hypothetical protein KC466_18570 [Myxococcales bacterium]|nr:hypothetical protein [Myxococcales bacterium]
MARLERAGRDLVWWRALPWTDRLRWTLFWAWEAWRAGEGDAGSATVAENISPLRNRHSERA